MQLVKNNSCFLWRWLSAWLFLLGAEAIWWSYEEFGKVVSVQAIFENVDIFCGYNFGGKCIPDFYSANREETSMGVVFNNRYRKSKRVAAQICWSGECEKVVACYDDVVVDYVVTCNKVDD